MNGDEVLVEFLATVEKSRAGLSDQALRPETALKFSRESSHGGHPTREKRRRAALAICCVSPVELAAAAVLDD